MRCFKIWTSLVLLGHLGTPASAVLKPLTKPSAQKALQAALSVSGEVDFPKEVDNVDVDNDDENDDEIYATVPEKLQVPGFSKSTRDSDSEDASSTSDDAVHRLVRRATTSIGPVSSQLQLHLGKLHSYADKASAGTLVAVGVLAFVIGLICVPIFASASRRSDTRMALLSQPERLTAGTDINGVSSGSDAKDAVENLMLAFDFETQDDFTQKKHRWQWCDEDQLRRQGLSTGAPTKPYQGYKRHETTLTKQGVERILSEAKVDFTVFDKEKDGEEVLWKLLRNEAYFMRTTYANLATQKVLLVIETVRLRWVHDGRILIQKSDNIQNTEKFSLPGQERPSCESPITTAQQLWQDILKLPLDIAKFAADSTDDHEMLDRKGLQCIERTHTIDVQLKAFVDDDILAKVGLPAHEDFVMEMTESLKAEAREEKIRSFTWLTEEATKASGVKINNYAVFEPKRRSVLCGEDFGTPTPANKRATRTARSTVSGKDGFVNEELKKFLEDAGVNIESPIWQDCKRGCSRLEELAKELASGRCTITNTSSGCHRCVNVVALRLWSPDRSMMLVEKGHKYEHGEHEWFSQLPGAKRNCRDDLTEVVMKICQQQLGLDEGDVQFSSDSAWEYYEYSETSHRYLGLLTKYQKFFVDVTIEEDDALWDRVGLSGKLYPNAVSV